MQDSQTFSTLREAEVLREFKDVLNVIAHWLAIPLFLLFWGSDLIYVPEQKWLFLALRLGIIPICILTNAAVKIAKTSRMAEIIAASHAIALATVINIMIANISDPGTT